MEQRELERSGGAAGTEVARSGGFRWFIDSMVGYWILLLLISLCASAIIYEVWLKGTI